MLQNSGVLHPAGLGLGAGHGETLPDDNEVDSNSIFLKHDRIYEHSLMRINYTTYDVRRSQDVVNTSTSHCNVMVLDGPPENSARSSSHKFRYARII
jgi:hypothetical protein